MKPDDRLRIACQLDGGIGDQVLAVPAVRYLIHELRSCPIDIRLGGWRGRARLFRTLLDHQASVCSIQTIAKAAAYDWIIDFDTRDAAGPESSRPPVFGGSQLRAKSFEQAERTHWQTCFTAAHHAITLLQRGVEASLPSDEVQARFRTLALAAPSSRLHRRIDSLLGAAHRPILAVTPGGRSPSYKRWPVERFASVIRYAALRNISVLVLGDAPEVVLADSICRSLPKSILKRPGAIGVLTGRTTLQDLPYLMDRVDLHLTNDNGLAHIGGLLNCRQIILYRGTMSPHVTAGFRDITMYSGQPADMRGITVDQVVEQVERVLSPRSV